MGTDSDDEGLVRRALLWADVHHITVMVLGVVGGPVLVTGVFSMKDDIKPDVLVYGLLVVGILFWIAGVLSASMPPRSPLRLLESLRRAELQRGEYQGELEAARSATRTAHLRWLLLFGWMKTLATYGANGSISEDEWDNGMELTLRPLLVERARLFGGEQEAFWSFGVYLHHPRNDSLYPVVRMVSDEILRSGLGRIWPSGVGQVGRAFIEGKPITCGDLTEPSLKELTEPPYSLKRSDDDELYKSMAVFPVSSDDKDTKPVGCLVATSSQPHLLTAENTKILQAATIHLYTFVKLYDGGPESIIERKHGEIRTNE